MVESLWSARVAKYDGVTLVTWKFAVAAYPEFQTSVAVLVPGNGCESELLYQSRLSVFFRFDHGFRACCPFQIPVASTFSGLLQLLARFTVILA